MVEPRAQLGQLIVARQIDLPIQLAVAELAGGLRQSTHRGEHRRGEHPEKHQAAGSGEHGSHEEGSLPGRLEVADVGGQLSPDGRWLAYGSDESGQMEVYVTSFPEPGRKWQVSKDGGYPVKWRGDGREIFHLGDATVRGTAVETRGSSLRVGAIRDLFSVRHADDGDLAADGQRGVLAIPLGGREIVPLTLVVNWTGDLE